MGFFCLLNILDYKNKIIVIFVLNYNILVLSIICDFHVEFYFYIKYFFVDFMKNIDIYMQQSLNMFYPCQLLTSLFLYNLC